MPPESLLISTEEMERQTCKHSSLRRLSYSSKFFSNAQFIDHLYWNKKKECVSHSYFLDKEAIDDYKKGSTFSFLLAANHNNLDTKTRFCFNDPIENFFLSFDLSTDFSSKVVINPSPSVMQLWLAPSEVNSSVGLFIIKCLESQDQYELDIGFRGVVISNVKGKLSWSLNWRTNVMLIFVFQFQMWL